MDIRPFSDELDLLVARIALQFQLPSLCVGIWRNGQAQFSCTGRRRAVGERADPQTIYPIGSVSKSFIAAAIMQLCEKGQVALDAPVTAYLKDFALSDPARTPLLTVRDMLCHRSGLPRHDASLFTNGHVSLAQTVENIRWLEPAWPARQRFCCQNHMYAAASLLVEQVSGMPWGKYVQRNIFEPLGMTRSYTASLEYRKKEKNYARPRLPAGPLNLPAKAVDADGIGAAGSLSAPAGELLHWTVANLRGGSFEGARLFSSASAAELHGRQMPIRPGEIFPYGLPGVEALHYGLGWFNERYRGETLVYHGGAITGFRSLIGFLPAQNFAFAVLTNQDRTLATTALGYLLCDWAFGDTEAIPPLPEDGSEWGERMQALASAQKERAKRLYERNTAPATLAPPPAEHCTGWYAHPAYGRCQVTARGGKLTLRIAGRKLRLQPGGDTGLVAVMKPAGVAWPCAFAGAGGSPLEQTAGKPAAALYAWLEPDLPAPIRFTRVE